jgi:hypothetical protein
MENKAFYKKRKFWYWAGGVFAGLLLILVIAGLLVAARWKPTLTTKIKEGVVEASNGLYHVDFKDIQLNALTGTVILDSIKLTPDTVVYQQLIARKEAPTHLFRIKLAHLKVSRVSLMKAYFDKQIDLTAIILDNPSIDMIYTKVPKRQDTVKDERTLYQQISKSLKSISIDQIKVIDADFDYYNKGKKLQSIKHLHVNVKDILVDSLAQFDTTRVFHSKNIGFELIGYKSLSKDKMYTLKLDTLKGSIEGRNLDLRGFEMIPMYPDLAFSRKIGVQKDRYDLKFNRIDLGGINYINLNNEGELHVDELAISNAKANIFMNRELSPQALNKGDNFPHLAVRRIPIPTVIKKISLDNVDVAYTEFNPKTKERGTVKLNNLAGTISNVTNDSVRLAANSFAHADLSTQIMGAAKMDVKIDFNLTSKNAAFSYKGTIGSFDMKVLNPLSKSLGQIEIESGMVKSVSFNINGNLNSASGDVVFLYQNLKVKMFGEDDDGKTKKKGFLSFLANKLVIKDDNPTKGETRTTHPRYERLPQASFFNLMWKTIFVGIRETVGIGFIPMKKMQEPKTSAKKQ